MIQRILPLDAIGSIGYLHRMPKRIGWRLSDEEFRQCPSIRPIGKGVYNAVWIEVDSN